ncbi:GntR family transcriptional regulator [Cellulomonas sp. DKR-3]|uniref:GntR family transcriptional regulator n=1 Tax=Cellulomonas fulva TaxID=2835530 RepID=A0ABS5TV55_9CELL|nr:GntR family transcriptional regulator [Cellulomonas fulva]MBT0992991.1 GntR family transcriptional regulator [Cellulomonas fulva]
MVNDTTPQQVAYRRVLDEVQRGVHAPGSRLPAERQMAADLGVSRMTLRAALTRLAAEGVLDRSAQRGWFVARQLLGEPPSTLLSFSEMATARGLRATSQVLVQRTRPCDLSEAERLGIAPTAPVVEVERVRGFEGTPVCLDRSVVPRALCPSLESVDLTDASLYRTLEDAGVAIHRSSYTVQAAAAGPRVAELLHLELGAPVLVGVEVAFNATGAPVLLGHAEYRGDAYRFEADLFRERART